MVMAMTVVMVMIMVITRDIIWASLRNFPKYWNGIRNYDDY